LGVFKKFEYEKLQSKKKRESILKKKQLSTPTPKAVFKHEESTETPLNEEEGKDKIKETPVEPKTEVKEEVVKNDSSDEKERKDWRREIWELKIWNYSIFSKNFFCFFSPIHVLFMMVLSSVSNHATIILFLILMYSNSILVIHRHF
jgi:hypothetical protein